MTRVSDLLSWRKMRLVAPAVLVFATLIVASFEASHAPAASFTWEAAIDRPTGVATSREFSSVRILQNDAIQDSVIQQTSKDFVASWADFLCQGRITFGLLQTKHDSIAGTASLHFRGFPRLPILTFGSVQKRQPHQWELPIMPSWLALPPEDEDEDEDDDHPTTKNKRGGPNHHFGSLRFKCKPIKNHRRGKSGREMDDKSSSALTLVQLESQIVDYRPWLAGKARPISRVRKLIYLNTQSRIHAYVTRRFHHAWREALTAAFNATKVDS
jgi:hypothetical protein